MIGAVHSPTMPARVSVVGPKDSGMRLDLFLTRHYSRASSGPEWSRAGIQRMIAEGEVTVNGRAKKSGARLKAGDLVEIRQGPPRDAALQAEALPLDILYEDEDCLVVNKPAGMVVHPGSGRRSGTLVNALLHHCPDLRGIGGEKRPGIVHRLDKDTSGAMVVAKHEAALQRLAFQFRERRVRKEYLALVWGLVRPAQGMIDRPIGRHRSDRKRMSSLYTLPRMREAATQWRVEEAFRLGPGSGLRGGVTLLRLKPLSGRTHQIRVHLADQGYPVVGDRIYGRKGGGLKREDALLPALADFPRQALHAEKLGFSHPRTGAAVEIEAPLPLDMERLLQSLRERCLTGAPKKAGEGG